MSNSVTGLPKRRTGRLTSWLDRSPLWLILIVGLALYSIAPIALSVVELASSSCGLALVNNAQGKPVTGIWDLLYFNFTTILTVGYGDYTPVLFGRFISVAEAVFGVVLFGVIVAVATIKAMLPPKNAVAFSKYGYYCTDEQRFLVIFVNTTSTFLVNPEMCSYYRQGTDWVVSTAYRAPFIGHSVWTFFIDSVPVKKLISGTDQDNALRFGITGQLGLTTVSAFVEYEPDNIMVIPNRNELVTFKGFRNADLANGDVQRMFHYHPDGSENLTEYLQRKKRETDGTQG